MSISGIIEGDMATCFTYSLSVLDERTCFLLLSRSSAAVRFSEALAEDGVVEVDVALDGVAETLVFAGGEVVPGVEVKVVPVTGGGAEVKIVPVIGGGAEVKVVPVTGGGAEGAPFETTA
jgi:hypothetical protein